MKKYMKINHTDNSQKVFFKDGVTPRCLDLTSPELTDIVNKKINLLQGEIDMWEELLTNQKDWIDAKKSS